MVKSIGNKLTKEATTSKIKAYYKDKSFKQKDVYDIAKNTPKEKELFDYAGIDKYYSKDNIEL